MTEFVIGLLVVQLLLGAYLFSFTLSAGMKHGTARATRLPAPVLFGHPGLALTSTVLWVVWMATGERGWAWATFVAMVLAVGGGLFLVLRTVRGGDVVDRPAALDPADVRRAERQIPYPAIGLHGLIALTLVVCTLLVALDIVE